MPVIFKNAIDEAEKLLFIKYLPLSTHLFILCTEVGSMHTIHCTYQSTVAFSRKNSWEIKWWLEHFFHGYPLSLERRTDR